MLLIKDNKRLLKVNNVSLEDFSSAAAVSFKRNACKILSNL